jgi:hypothetical protein
MMNGTFGKAFHTRKEANAWKKKLIERGDRSFGLEVRKMSKKIFPRRKKLFHVGTKIDFLNFA